MDSAEALQQVRSGRVEQVVCLEVEAIDAIASATAGPSISAIAIARFNATIGDGWAMSRSYSCTICDQSVSAAVPASLCTALMASWIW